LCKRCKVLLYIVLSPPSRPAVEPFPWQLRLCVYVYKLDKRQRKLRMP